MMGVVFYFFSMGALNPGARQNRYSKGWKNKFHDIQETNKI